MPRYRLGTMLKRIDHVAITVSDLDTSVDFYCRALGFTEIARWTSEAPGIKGIVFLELNGTVIELIAPDKVQQRGSVDGELPGLRHICLRTDDLDHEVKRLMGMGVRFLRTPQTIDAAMYREDRPCPDYPLRKGLRRAVVEDPDGVGIELLEARSSPGQIRTGVAGSKGRHD